MKSNNTFYKFVLALEPVIIFICVKELVKLIIHNLAMNFSANDLTALGINWGQFKTFQEVTDFLQSKAVYLGVLANLILLIIIGIMYIRESKRKKSAKTPDLSFFIKTVIAIVCVALVVDNLISISGLRSVSIGYQTTTQTYVGIPFWAMVLATGVLAPLVEELVFRGLVYSRCRELLGKVGATIISAASFGLIHGNLVQFVYAGILGIFFCFFYEKGRSIWVPVICHMVINIVALLSNYYGIFNWMYTNNMVLIGSLLVYTGLGVIMISNIRGRK